MNRGHRNLYIPSTFSGNCIENGQVNQDVLCKNLDLAIDNYISLVNKSPCGSTVIHLYKGADAADYIAQREYLKIFLKGSKQKKNALKKEHPALYSEFEMIWQIRNNHLIVTCAQQYIFYLLACFKPGCSHPLCKNSEGSKNREDFLWFLNGPNLTQLPLPVPDPKRPWGAAECTDCKGCCHGHYLDAQSSLEPQVNGSSLEPPSTVLLRAHKSREQIDVDKLAKQVMLPVEEVRLWLDHLETVSTNRKKGAEKAAETRRKKKSASVCLCGVCGIAYEEETEQEEQWIGCDGCDHWFHWTCVNIVTEPEKFLCDGCVH